MFQRTMLTGLVAIAMLSGCDGQDTETVGPRGGVVTSPDGRVTLEVPAGALDQEVAITIDEVDAGHDGAVGPTYEILPRGLAFNEPATLVYDVSEGMDVAADQVIVVTEAADGWNALADFDADMDAQLLYASVLYLSTYAPILE
jgi:hypothetical protein